MRAVMLMFDTLSRNFLPNYGGETAIMPNFQRLKDKTVTFDEFYGGSMPCMPARRELHTGCYNFLHRGWGPLEPFDNSCIESMSANGIYTHLVTDHSHYWEDGGATYHGRYDSWEGFRGQEGDRWVARSQADMSLNTNKNNKKNLSAIQHLANRTRIVNEEDMPSIQTVSAGIDFIRQHADRNNWFLQIECFDPHEPFYVPDRFRKMYELCDAKDAFNFPAYGPTDGKYSQEEIEGLRKEYMALLSMCDEQLGRVIDLFDELGLWKDTMLIVNTDHGFFLGEHDFIGKNFPPMYDEVIHTPFFIHDPRGDYDGLRCSHIAQTVDIVPTLMNYFGLEEFKDMDGRDLSCTYNENKAIHETILYGIHGGQINMYDGRYVYMKGSVSKDKPVYHMTMMPTNMRGFFKTEDLNEAELVNGGKYSHDNIVMKVPTHSAMGQMFLWPDAIYDKTKDIKQENNIISEELEKELSVKLVDAMRKADAPDWQYSRIGLKKEIKNEH